MVATAAQSTDLRRCYAANGFVVIDELWGRAAIESVLDRIKHVFSSAANHHNEPDGDFERLLERMFAERFETYWGAAKLCNHLIELHQLGLDARVAQVLKTLGLTMPTICARPLLWFHSPALAKTDRYHRLPAHQEWSNMQGSLDGAVVWAPLVDIDDNMGRLQVIPASHRDGLLPLVDGDDHDYPLAIDPKRVDDQSFVEVDVPVGGALVFSAFLVHRSGNNQSSRARLTMNFRFNNAAEPSFIARNYLNPFLYEAPVRLLGDESPTRDDLQAIWPEER